MRRGDLYSCLTSCLLLCFLSSVNGEVCLDQRLPNRQHGINGRLCFIDQTTLVIRGFEYDGRGPAAYLYYYDTDSGYTASNVPRDGGGEIIPHPRTQGSFPRERETGGDLQFSLPDGVYACDMAVFTIWCRLASTHFTTIDIPQDIFTASEPVGSDQILCNRVGGGGRRAAFENCMQLDPSLSVAWTVNRTSESVEFLLCGCTSTGADQDNTWLGFGLSGSSSQTRMRGADATIVWVDEDEGPQARDYFLSEYSQCRNGVGACPDTVHSSGTCSNDVTLIDGFRQDGEQCVVFSRKFAAADDTCDLPLDPDNEEQYIVWGVGGLGETAFRHFIRAQSTDPPIHLGRDGSNDCVALQCSSCDPFQNDRIVAPSSTTFVARIGPSGDQRGYIGITGRAGWGIAWFIDGTLIPELVVERGQTYTFIVFGGDDPNNLAQYHPLYITNSPNGGRSLNTAEQQANEEVYAGLENGEPTGVGPLCEYESTIEAERLECDTQLCQYEDALNPPAEKCGEDATKNVVTWTPDSDTPDLVYYQCLTHQNLGWKIRVTDSVSDYTDDNPLTGTYCDSSHHTSASYALLLSFLLISTLALML